jgi:hypothetical protein
MERFILIICSWVIVTVYNFIWYFSTTYFIRLAMAKLPQGYKRWLVKQLSGHIGVGHMLQKRKWQDHSRCPLCNKINEKTSHVLGRWSPKWQKAQQNYYNLTRSKRTSKRWATAIIHKILLTVWDQWQFRNSIAHSDEGPISIALHRQLNTRISEEFQHGYAEISADKR